MQLQAHSLGRKRMHDLSVTREHILFHYNIYLQFLIVATMKQTDLILKNPATTDEKFNNLILQGSFRLCKWLSLRRLVLWINHLPPACWSTFCKSIFKHQFGCRFDILDSISSFFCILTYAIIYVLIHHIIFLLYLYFWNILFFSSTHVQTSSVDVVLVLSISIDNYQNYEIARGNQLQPRFHNTCDLP